MMMHAIKLGMRDALTVGKTPLLACCGRFLDGGPMVAELKPAEVVFQACALS
jgi:hypothetical protein